MDTHYCLQNRGWPVTKAAVKQWDEHAKKLRKGFKEVNSDC